MSRNAVKVIWISNHFVDFTVQQFQPIPLSIALPYTSSSPSTVDLMRHGKDERVRGTAAQALLDRGWGKAKVEVVSNAESSYLEILKAVNAPLS